MAPSRLSISKGLLIGLCCLALASCKKSAPAEGSAGNSGAPAPVAGGGSNEANSILIGEYGSFTGPQATFGISTHKGIMLAVNEVNAAGGVKGKKIEIKSYDDKGAAQEAGTAVTRLITEDKVKAILGEVASSLSIAGGDVAQSYGVPMISPSSTNPRVTMDGDTVRSMVFRVCFLDPFQAYAGAKFAVDNLKARKIATLYDQAQAYSKGLNDNFVEQFEKMGGAITTQQAYNSGDVDFSAQLGSIKETNPDVIYVPGYYTDVGNISIQARRLGITCPLLGGDGWDSSQLTKIGGKAIEGSYYTNHYSHQEHRPIVDQFVKKFAAANDGETPDGLAALGYDAARLIFDAMRRAPSLDGKDLAQAIAETKDFEGVTGNITIDKQHNARKSAVVVQIQDGAPVYVATIPPPPEN